MPAMAPWLSFWLAFSLAVAAEAPSEVVDRIVAAVDGDPILLSDLNRAIAFDPTLRRQEGESAEASLQRALEELVRERIRFHEVNRVGAGRVAAAEIAELAETTRSRFPTEEAFLAALSSQGMTERDLEGMLARRLAIFHYVNDRLRSQVFVDATEIQRYYDTELRSQLEGQGDELPRLTGELRESIRRTVMEVKLNAEEERWLRELEAKADVVLLLESPANREALVVTTLGETPP